jgi:hypothetical protein
VRAVAELVDQREPAMRLDPGAALVTRDIGCVRIWQRFRLERNGSWRNVPPSPSGRRAFEGVSRRISRADLSCSAAKTALFDP